MNVEYVAFDSHGVKSMCTRVETKDAVVTIDPGVAYETNSFPLSLEERLRLVGVFGERIKESCEKSDTVVVTHYHYDHHVPARDERMFWGKRLLVKNPSENVNKSQRVRGRTFLDSIFGLPERVEFADNKEYTINNTTLSFTEPLWHGSAGTKLGYILGVNVSDSFDSLFYSSDVSGVLDEKQVEVLLKTKATTLVIDGPPTYLLGYVFSRRSLLKSVTNLIKVVNNTSAKTIILDHHLLRDYRYRELLSPVYERASEVGVTVTTAAESQGFRPSVLECYERNGPTKWRRWSKLTLGEIEESAGED